MLLLKNINTGYGRKQILYNLHLELNSSETTLLVGTNGSGKSTLLKAIYKLVPLWQLKDRGTIIFNGENITDQKTSNLIGMGIVYAMQKDELFPNLSCERNLELSVAYLNSKEKTMHRLNETYEQIPQLQILKDSYSQDLSGGERKLLSLGMAIMNRPRLLLLDEPLAGASGKNESIILNQIQNLKNKGVTLLIVEHRIEKLLEISDRIVGIKSGRISNLNLNSNKSITSFLLS